MHQLREHPSGLDFTQHSAPCKAPIATGGKLKKCQVFCPAELCCGRTEFYPFSFKPLLILCILCYFITQVSCPETLHPLAGLKGAALRGG